MVNELKNISEEVSTGVTIVDVWAPWCGPCTAMTPIFEQLSDEFTNIKFMKSNIDDVPVFARKYKIKSVPTFIILEDGIVREQITGLVTITFLRDVLRNY